MRGLEFRDVRKSFGGVRALDGVSFDVCEGEAHAIVGENGAGKSTLLKILGGVLAPDAGTMCWHGARLHHRSPREALGRGIATVYQDILAFPDLTVSANVFAGRELRRAGWLLEREMRERTAALLADLHLPVSPNALVGSLSPAQSQLVQVARALAFDCRILVLDEPTTALTDAETDHLFHVLGRLKSRGVTLIYVSHRLPEVFRLCDRITVLRDGHYISTFDRETTQGDDVVRAMVGRAIPTKSGKAGSAETSAPILGVERLTRRPFFADVSLSVRPREIVALFGLVGSGRSPLLETLFGLHRPRAGRITIDGKLQRFRSVRQAMRAGVVLVPEDRQHQGLFYNLSLEDNLMLSRETARGGLIVRHGQEREIARRLIADWAIKAASSAVLPDSLSGGNQQKAVLARWLAASPRVVLLDEPTKGVDVGAKFEIHEMVRRLAAKDAGCLVASSDLPEVLALADRIVVMREGRVRGEVAAPATEEAVMRLATATPPSGTAVEGLAQGGGA